MSRTLRAASLATLLILANNAQARAQVAPPALDVTAADVKAFIDALPKDRVSDLPIRVTDVGGYRIGIYGVFRPRTMPGDANVHDTSVSEIYYILEGTGTLVTGGSLTDSRSVGASPNTGRQNLRGSGITGGVSRKVGPGDIIVIPGRLPHWFSALDTDLKYVIYRPDPESLQRLK